MSPPPRKCLEEDPESTTPPPTLYDDGPSDSRRQDCERDAWRSAWNQVHKQPEEKLAHLRTLYEDLGVKTNPPTDIEEWDQKVEKYRRDYNEYQAAPTQQSWAEYALSSYPEWEFPLLEKGRMLLEAIEAYSLTDEEEATVRQEYSSMSLDLANPLGNL